MENIWIKRLRRSVGLLYKQANPLYDWVTVQETYNNISGEEFQRYLKQKINEGKPLLITRFGSTECQCIEDGLNQPSISNILRYVFQGSTYYGWKPQTAHNMEYASGFYPATEENLLRFRDLILTILPEVDVLASWLKQELCFKDYFKDWESLPKCRLYDLEPYRYNEPWTYALKGKKVLVIHPFEDTIKSQWKNREKLFENPDVLPEFELITLKAVQSIAGNHPEAYASWFDALEAMEKQIDKIDFDVALLGCGAYGMPLAAYCKKIGKQAIHIGGALQHFFGIKSSRADMDDEATIRNLYNEYWAYPLQIDRPNNFQRVENGCYW